VEEPEPFAMLRLQRKFDFRSETADSVDHALGGDQREAEIFPVEKVARAICPDASEDPKV
jgi:hypothetical protein